MIVVSGVFLSFLILVHARPNNTNDNQGSNANASDIHLMTFSADLHRRWGVLNLILKVIVKDTVDFSNELNASGTDDDTRIVGGLDVPQGKYPSQVSIQVNGQHVCGGTILNKFSVLTAAHCFTHVKTRNSLAVVTSTVDLTKPGRRYKVARVIVHKNYRPSDLLANDIAIIKVGNPFSMKNSEGPVTISRKGIAVTSRTWGSVVGWGYTMPNAGYNANILKEVEQQLLSYRECSPIIGQIHDTQFCIHYPGNGKGICEGDSGGPVFSGGRQIGIMSWRDGNAVCGNSPAVATLLSRYIDWLIVNAA